MNLKIICDSTADLSDAMLLEHDIKMVPLSVVFGENSYLDKIELNNQDFFAMLKSSSVMPSTSQVNPDSFRSVFEEELKEHEALVYIGLSSKMSGTLQSAAIARDLVDPERILVFDSGLVTFALGLLILSFAEQKQKYASLVEVRQGLESIRDSIDSIFMVDTLEYLVRGGRLSKVSGLLGSMLQMKPLLTIEDGELKVIGKVRGKKKAIQQMLDMIEDKADGRKIKSVGFYHADDPESFEIFSWLFQERFKPDRIYQGEVGSVVGTHSGPGCLALSFIYHSLINQDSFVTIKADQKEEK